MTSIRQSALASFARCAQQVHLNQVAEAAGQRETVLSATAFGTVIHHALQVMEEGFHSGRPDWEDHAVRTFEHFWHPANIHHLVPGGVDVWLPRQNQGGLLSRGRSNLREYAAALRNDTGQLLALEHQFHVPWTHPDTGEIHDLTGTVDRLAIRITMAPGGRMPYVSVEDFKSGIKPTYLRHALQWTVYAYASTQPEFWVAWGEDLPLLTEPLAKKGLALFADGSGLPILPRRGRWIAMRDNFGLHDAGWRTQADFARMDSALAQYVSAVQHGLYPLSISGQTCTFCPHLYSGLCGGVPFSKEDEGRPYPGA